MVFKQKRIKLSELEDGLKDGSIIKQSDLSAYCNKRSCSEDEALNELGNPTVYDDRSQDEKDNDSIAELMELTAQTKSITLKEAVMDMGSEGGPWSRRG